TPPSTVSAQESEVWVSSSRFRVLLDRLSTQENCQITFDDGNLSDLQTAVPELLNRQLTAEFFVVVERIGATGYLSRGDLEEMIKSGMTIGSHGMRHVPWRALSLQDLRHEIWQSKIRLEQMLSTPIVHAACPFGSYNWRVL